MALLMEYHAPVMLHECVEGLAIDPSGVYVDVTFGGGGHARAILEKLGAEGRLVVFDQDPDAVGNAEDINDDRLIFVEANFRYLQKYLRLHGFKAVHGILADLGVSSHQLNKAERGFSTRFNAELDMRMDKTSAFSAKSLVNEYSEEALHKVLGIYGEVRNARTLAAAIVSARVSKPINTVDDLKNVLERFAPKGKSSKYYAQVFQAFRIVVNDEMSALEEMLTQTAEVLSPTGRLVIMSYHSLEDRMVKNFMAKGKFLGDVEKDFYGNMVRPFKPVTRKPVLASAAEIAQNNRARSAKLRIAEKQ